MRQRSLLGLALFTILAAACTPEQATSPTERRSPGVPDSVIVLAPSPGTCAAVPATIRATIITLFLNAGLGSSSAAVAQFELILQLKAANNLAGAQAQARDLATKLLKRYEGLPRIRKIVAKPLTLLIVKQLFCLVGINGVVFDLNPGDPAKAIAAQSGQAGVYFPPNVVQEGTIVTMTEIPAASIPLITPLDKYPTYLEVEKYPDLPLNGNPVVGVCFPAATPSLIAQRLLLGHQRKNPLGVDQGFELLAGIELNEGNFPPLLSALLACPAITAQGPEAAPKTWLGRVMAGVADFVLPAKVQARAMLLRARGGVGGSPGEFSPFGAVDPFLKARGGVGGSPGEFSPGLPGLQSGAGTLADPITGGAGTQVTTGLPIITVSTELGTPIPGVTVTFSVAPAVTPSLSPAGAATTCAGFSYTVVTNGSGQATMPCLDFGSALGYSNIKAEFDPSTLTFPGANLVTVNGNGVPGADLNFLVLTLAPPLPIEFKSSGYKYLGGVDARPFGPVPFPAEPSPIDPRAGLEGLEVPEGWEQPGFGEAGWTSALAPFVSIGGAFCGLNAAGVAGDHTNWPTLTDLLIRRSFSTSAAGTVRVDVYIDNDVQVYLDGELISQAPYLQPTSLIMTTFPGWAIHDGCPDGGANEAEAPAAAVPSGYPVFSKSVPAGNHTIAVRAHDYSGSTYFDMQVTFVPVVP